MAADKGFLDAIGVGSVDERALVTAARAEQRDNFRALGMGARRGVGALVGGAAGLLTGEDNGRSFKGILRNMSAGAQAREDVDAAQLAGISLEDLQARRAIRKELGKEEFAPLANEDPYDLRERMAARAAKIASQSGSASLQANALQTLKIVRDERMEYNKLQTAQNAAKQDLIKDGIHTAYDTTDGNGPVTGMLKQDEETGLWGLEFSNNGVMDFRAFGNGFTLEDPDAGTAKETPDQRMRRAFGKTHVDETREMIQVNASTMRKIGRVTESVHEYAKAGIDESVLGNSGKVVTWIDNGLRNIRGTLGAFMPIDQDKGGAAIDQAADPTGRFGNRGGNGWSGWNTWLGRAGDPTDGIWRSFKLPDWAQGVSAEAQEHRAQILELAYMAARLAEPSNRGLSDKDIEAAMARIAGDTSNPQQLLRRFVTIAADASLDLEERLDSYKQALPGIGDEEVDKYFGGKLLGDYRVRRGQLFDSLGVTFNENGRPMFDEYIDVQLDPGTNTFQGGTEGAAPVFDVNASPEDKAQAVRDLLE